ncbi:unnamed protein product [Lampetra fluviatilis]
MQRDRASGGESASGAILEQPSPSPDTEDSLAGEGGVAVRDGGARVAYRPYPPVPPSSRGSSDGSVQGAEPY